MDSNWIVKKQIEPPVSLCGKQRHDYLASYRTTQRCARENPFLNLVLDWVYVELRLIIWVHNPLY